MAEYTVMRSAKRKIRTQHLTKMAGKSVIGSQKEITAVIVNLKENRILEKSVQTLSLEESYATKLLDLNSKMARFRYERLKANVGRIKTYLKPEDIASLRYLEQEGKFKPEPHSVGCNSADKIHAAEQRLRLDKYRKMAVSATPRLENHPRSKSAAPRSHDHQESLEKRMPDGHLTQHKDACPSPVSGTLSGLTVDQSSKKNGTREALLRPKTAHLMERIAHRQKSRYNQNVQSLYSCHDEKQINPDRRYGASSAQGAFGGKPYEEQRIRLLSGENDSFNTLNKRKADFVTRIDRFVADNPSTLYVRPEATEEIIMSIDSMACRPGSSKMRTKSLNIDKLDSSLLKQFAEIRKTRYLRVDDSVIDLSGINTLAKDQYRGTQVWREIATKPRVSFKVAATL